MIQKHSQAGVAALGILFASVTLPALSGCKEATGSSAATQKGDPKVSYDGRALHVQVMNDGSRAWSYPLDLVGSYALSTYPSNADGKFSLVADLKEGETLKYRLEFKYGEPAAGISFFGLDGKTSPTLSPASKTITLESATLVVKEGNTLKQPQELLTFGNEPRAHRFVDLAGKAKRVTVMPMP